MSTTESSMAVRSGVLSKIALYDSENFFDNLNSKISASIEILDFYFLRKLGVIGVVGVPYPSLTPPIVSDYEL